MSWSRLRLLAPRLLAPRLELLPYQQLHLVPRLRELLY